VNTVIDEQLPLRLATSYPRRFTAMIKWDSRAKVWQAFIPELSFLSVCGATRDHVIESAKKAARSFIDRAATGGPPIPPDSYREILEVEVEVPLKGSLT
jgi:predicted RNase H-like HicB family nuclease